jgi:hypothetical protein
VVIKRYAIKEPNDIMYQAMKERKPTIIEAYVDPCEPPMLRKVEMEFVKEVAKSFAKGQPYAKLLGTFPNAFKRVSTSMPLVQTLSNVSSRLKSPGY